MKSKMRLIDADSTYSATIKVTYYDDEGKAYTDFFLEENPVCVKIESLIVLADDENDAIRKIKKNYKKHNCNIVVDSVKKIIT